MTDSIGKENEPTKSQPGSVVLFGGWVLYKALLRASSLRGDDEAALCGYLAVSKGYLKQVSTGLREPNTLSEEFLRASAAYLGIPYLLVQIIAGRISEQDLIELGNHVGEDMANVLKTAKAYAAIQDVG